MKRLLPFVALASLLLAIPAYGPAQTEMSSQHPPQHFPQQSDPSQQGDTTRPAALPRQHWLTLRHDNDYLNLAGQGTDEYYTAGLTIEFSFIERTGKNILDKVLFSPRNSRQSAFTIGLTQWMYTPNEISEHSSVKNDYPYCGILFLGLSRESLLSDRRLFRSTLWLGTIGPAALANPFQKLVHRITGSIVPDGWNSQIPDYPVINYNLEYESNILSFGAALKINGLGAIQTGSLLNTASVGLDILLSSERDDYFPDLAYNTRSEEPHRARFYLKFQPAIKFVAENSILQGGPFDKRNYYRIAADSLDRLILSAAGVMGLHTRKFSIQYQQVYESPEFRSVHYHVYGSIGIGFAL